MKAIQTFVRDPDDTSLPEGLQTVVDGLCEVVALLAGQALDHGERNTPLDPLTLRPDNRG